MITLTNVITDINSYSKIFIISKRHHWNLRRCFYRLPQWFTIESKGPLLISTRNFPVPGGIAIKRFRRQNVCLRGSLCSSRQAPRKNNTLNKLEFKLESGVVIYLILFIVTCLKEIVNNLQDGCLVSFLSLEGASLHYNYC